MYLIHMADRILIMVHYKGAKRRGWILWSLEGDSVAMRE